MRDTTKKSNKQNGDKSVEYRNAGDIPGETDNLNFKRKMEEAERNLGFKPMNVVIRIPSKERDVTPGKRLRSVDSPPKIENKRHCNSKEAADNTESAPNFNNIHDSASANEMETQHIQDIFEALGQTVKLIKNEISEQGITGGFRNIKYFNSRAVVIESCSKSQQEKLTAVLEKKQ